jgi:conjugative transfer signal peptidase TraF
MMMTGLFDRIRTTRLATVKRLALIVAGAGIGTFQVCGIVGVRINASPSLPVGLYLTSSHPEVNLVEFCPAEPFASFAIARGYRGAGVCQDGAAPLMKPIVARAGDLVEVSGQGIAVNGRLLPNTAPMAVDSHGRSLTPWPFGRYVVASDSVWVASSHHPRSFDSRYLGPIPVRSIRDHVRPLLTAW